MKTTEKEVNVRQALFRDNRCLALAANAVTTCIHNSLEDKKTQHKHKTQEVHNSKQKTGCNVPSNCLMTSEKLNQKHTKCIFYRKYSMTNT